MYQNITVVGNLGRDPELRHTGDGKPVCAFSVAVDDGYGENKKTIWFKVSAFGKQAEACNEWLLKGSKVLVAGRMNFDAETGGPRMWKDKDGNARTNFEITARDVTFISGTKSKGEAAADGEAAIPF